VAQVQRSTEDPPNFRRGAIGVGIGIAHDACTRSARRILDHLNPQIRASARGEFEVSSNGDGLSPWILGTPTAEDAPRQVERDVAAVVIDTL
jgi:hypothetical protein